MCSSSALCCPAFVRLRCGQLEGQHEVDGGAPALCALEGEGSAHGLHQVVDDGEPQPSALVGAGEVHCCLDKGGANLADHFIGDAYAGVADGEEQPRLARGGRGQACNVQQHLALFRELQARCR